MIIHKYQVIDTPGEIRLSMPADATIMTVQEQDGSIVIWAKHNEALALPLRPVTIVCAFTGKSFEGGEYYIGTVQKYGLVMHYFQKAAR